MNCPYCDESIHGMAKYCPKCGLPVKEDATLMGASLGGDEGPSRAMMIGGAVAVVAVALWIGWASAGRGGGPGETVRRERVGSYAAAAPAPNLRASRYAAAPASSAFNTPGSPASAASRVTAWPKPATGAAARKPLKRQAAPPPEEPAPPRHDLRAMLPPPSRWYSVSAARPTEPAIPSLPLVQAPMPAASLHHLNPNGAQPAAEAPQALPGPAGRPSAAANERVLGSDGRWYVATSGGYVPIPAGSTAMGAPATGAAGASAQPAAPPIYVYPGSGGGTGIR